LLVDRAIESISDAANRWDSPETVRTSQAHLCQTGVNRQSALAYLLGAAAVARVP
jgi:hypothetical protein